MNSSMYICMFCTGVGTHTAPASLYRAVGRPENSKGLVVMWWA